MYFFTKTSVLQVLDSRHSSVIYYIYYYILVTNIHNPLTYDTNISLLCSVYDLRETNNINTLNVMQIPVRWGY